MGAKKASVKKSPAVVAVQPVHAPAPALVPVPELVLVQHHVPHHAHHHASVVLFHANSLHHAHHHASDHASVPVPVPAPAPAHAAELSPAPQLMFQLNKQLGLYPGAL